MSIQKWLYLVIFHTTDLKGLIDAINDDILLSNKRELKNTIK